MKKYLIFAVAIVSLFFVSCNGSGKKKYNSHAQEAIKAAEQFEEEGQAAEEEYEEYLDAKKELNPNTETEKSQQTICNDRGCGGKCGLNHGDVDNRFQSPEINIYNGNTIPGEKKTEKVEGRKSSTIKEFFSKRTDCPTCPTISKPEPERVKEEKAEEVEKVVEDRKDECLTCNVNSFLLFQYGKAFCVVKATGDVFKYNGELSAADKRQLETSKKLKTGLCIHKVSASEYKICNLDGSAFSGEPWK